MKKTNRANVTIPEMIDFISNCETSAEKIELLSMYKNNKALIWFVYMMYNYDFTGFYIPEYKASSFPPDLCRGNIGTQAKRIEAAINAFKRGDTKKYDDLMNLVLEGVSREEALLLESLFSNKKIESVHKSVWRKLYPQFFRT
jgi:hypothetical protein